MEMHIAARKAGMLEAESGTFAAVVQMDEAADHPHRLPAEARARVMGCFHALGDGQPRRCRSRVASAMLGPLGSRHRAFMDGFIGHGPSHRGERLRDE